MKIEQIIKKLEICPICESKTINNTYANVLFCPNNPLRCETYFKYVDNNTFDLYLYIGEKIILNFSRRNKYISSRNNHPFDKLKIKDIFGGKFKTKLKTVMLLA